MTRISIAWDEVHFDNEGTTLYFTTLPEHAENLLAEGLGVGNGAKLEITNAPVRIGPRTAPVVVRLRGVAEEQLRLFEVERNGYRAFAVPAGFIREHGTIEAMTHEPEFLGPWDVAARANGE